MVRPMVTNYRVARSDASVLLRGTPTISCITSTLYSGNLSGGTLHQRRIGQANCFPSFHASGVVPHWSCYCFATTMVKYELTFEVITGSYQCDNFPGMGGCILDSYSCWLDLDEH